MHAEETAGDLLYAEEMTEAGSNMELLVLWSNIASTIQHLHLLGITLIGSTSTSHHEEV